MTIVTLGIPGGLPSPLFALRFRQISVLVQKGPFLRGAIREHLPLGLLRKILITTLLHQLEKQLVHNAIISRPGRILLWRHRPCHHHGLRTGEPTIIPIMGVG